jgi:PPOX class probable F420-dependent enzyme
MLIDTATDFGRRVAQRLENDRLVWLTTVAQDGTPQPSPIWFLWDGRSVLMYSRPNTPKLRHIQRNPNVSLNFDGNGQGGDIVVLTGQAHLAEGEPPANKLAAYTDKYGEMIRRIGMDAETFAKGYSVPVRITLARLRGHL